MRKIYIVLIVVVVSLAALVWGGWLVAVPGDILERLAEENMRGGGFEADLVGFNKGLFYNVSADSLDIKQAGMRMLAIENLRVKLDVPRSLLGLKAIVFVEGTIGGGALMGEASIGRKSYSLNANLDGTELGQLGLYELAGADGTGRLSAEAHMENRKGEARFTITDAKFKPLVYQNNIVPLNLFHTSRGAVTIDGRTVNLDSVAFEGEGLHARARGTIKGRTVDMKLEIMPDGDDLFLTALIGQYRVSPGYYVIPIRSRL